MEADSLYEGVEPGTGEGAVDGMTGKDRSETVNWDYLTKSTKPENIEGVIIAGICCYIRLRYFLTVTIDYCHLKLQSNLSLRPLLYTDGTSSSSYTLHNLRKVPLLL